MARVVFTITEEQDEVAGGVIGIWFPAVAAGRVERVEDGSKGLVATRDGAYGGRSSRDVFVVVGPILTDQGLGVELFDESAVVSFAEQLGSIGVNDCTVEREIAEHRGADIEEKTGPNGEVVVFLQRDDIGLDMAIICEPEVIAGEVGEWPAIRVGGVEGEGDFVDGDFERVGMRCLRDGEGEEACGHEQRQNASPKHI